MLEAEEEGARVFEILFRSRKPDVLADLLHAA